MLFADIGIPMIGAVIALGWLTIIPVIIVETIVAMWLLRWRTGFALRHVSLANTVSMLLGFPLMWFLSVLVSILIGETGWGDGSIIGVLRGPAWLGPGYIPDLGWAVPFALIVLCVPFFLMSWWIEYLVLFRIAAEGKQEERVAIRTYAWKANLASYALLVLFLIAAMTGRW
jgi:hypothetical protein